MKNKIIMIGIIIFLIVTNCITIYSVTNNVTLETEKTKVKVGESFSVYVKAVAPEGINGLVTTFKYDTEKLEFVSKKLLKEDFVDLGGTTANEIVLMFNPRDLNNYENVTDVNIYELTFKVKEGIESNNITEIELINTEISTLGDTNSEMKLPGDKLEITLLEKEEEQQPENGNPPEEEQQPENGNPPEEEEQPEGGNPPEEEKQPNDDKQPTDNTKVDEEYKYAGIGDYTLILILIGVLVAIISYIKINKYTGIEGMK